MKPPMTPQEYAAAVRDALGDLPARDRDELLEDLDEHLAEVAAESGESLEERLGSPEAYAAELRAAYGGRAPGGGGVPLSRRLRERAPAGVRRVHTRLLVLPPYRQVVAFAPELRPAWWVLRGYAVALAMLAPVGDTRLVPGDIPSWVFTLAVIWGSVRLGRRSRTRSPGWGRALLLGANTVVAVLVIAAMADPPSSDSVAFDHGPPPVVVAPGITRVENVSSFSGPVYNIFPYAEDGTPLRNVRLYDQDGNPITVEPGLGQELVIPCNGEPPIRNAYPLPLRSVDPATRGLGETCAPVPPTPTAAAGPLTEPPAQPSASPSAEPSPEPSVSPSGELAPEPSVSSSGEPSDIPSAEPSSGPSDESSASPTR